MKLSLHDNATTLKIYPFCKGGQLAKFFEFCNDVKCQLIQDEIHLVLGSCRNDNFPKDQHTKLYCWKMLLSL